jgi:hypothetical protein
MEALPFLVRSCKDQIFRATIRSSLFVHTFKFLLPAGKERVATALGHYSVWESDPIPHLARAFASGVGYLRLLHTAHRQYSFGGCA